MTNRLAKYALSVVAGLELVTFAGIGSIAVAYHSIPAADKGSAYTLGLRFALTADHILANWNSEAPKLGSNRPEEERTNRYVWQTATLVRPAKCLDATSVSQRATIASQGECRTKLVYESNRLYYSVTKDQSIKLKVQGRPPANGSLEGRGAMFAVEGQIGIGHSLKNATLVNVELNALGLNGADRDDPAVGGCDQPRPFNLHQPILLRLLPRPVARVCRFQFDDQTSLSLVQYQRGLMQATHLTDAVMCQAMLIELLGHDASTGMAGCIGAHWNQVERTEINLVLFERTGEREFAMIR